MSEPDPTTDPSLKSRLTVRMEMFEVYERRGGEMAFLFATSDPSEAQRGCTEPTDQIVKRWWVREGKESNLT